MKLFDFMCMNKDCEKFEQRFARGFPTARVKDQYPPKCDSCKTECTGVDPNVIERAPAGISIQGDFGTPIRGDKKFAKGLSSKDPADLKRDLDSGNLFN